MTEDMTAPQLMELERELDELEASDIDVGKARASLDAAFEALGIPAGKMRCVECGHPLDLESHNPECSRWRAPISVSSGREAGSYSYMNEFFEVLHTTSVPCDLDEALQYFPQIAAMFRPEDVPVFIAERPHDKTQHVPLPFRYDHKQRIILALTEEVED